MDIPETRQALPVASHFSVGHTTYNAEDVDTRKGIASCTLSRRSPSSPRQRKNAKKKPRR
jgi:hypothetical protein